MLEGHVVEDAHTAKNGAHGSPGLATLPSPRSGQDRQEHGIGSCTRYIGRQTCSRSKTSGGDGGSLISDEMFEYKACSGSKQRSVSVLAACRQRMLHRMSNNRENKALAGEEAKTCSTVCCSCF